MLDVITIGSSTVDFFLETEFPLRPWDSSLGSAMIIPLGEKFSAIKSLITTGGNAVNTAVTFKRQGLRVATAIKLGGDIAGQMIYNRLQEEGIKDKFVVWDGDAMTSRSAVLLEHGERSIITYQGSGAALTISDLDLKKIRAKWWYVSLSGDSYKLFPIIAKKSREMGVKLALNPTMKHLRDGKKQLLANLKYTDFLVLNEGEAAELTGVPFSERLEIFKAIDKLVPGIVAITRGSKGSVVSDGSHVFKTGIFKEKKMEDRTGAGDAYGAGFIAGLIRAKAERGECGCDTDKLEYAIRLATANSASVVEHIGASEGALYKRDFDGSSRYKTLKIVKDRIK
ncbi:MAG: carbohydrate kinase family protein [Parcubacteria group bacterium]